MERRAFLRTGIAAGISGAAGLGTTARMAYSSPIIVDGPLRLSSNENSLGLAPAARKAVIDAIPEANRYPRAQRQELIHALADKHGVTTRNIVLGCGSTEVLQVMVQANASRRASMITADPTFEDVFDYGTPETYRIEKVPLTSNLAHDIGRMRELAARSWDPVLVYICNPNNPTGTLTQCSEIDEWIEDAPQNVHFLIDEAYFEYVDDGGYWSMIKWIAEKPNVIIARTFSKIYGMAGMRLGYGIAHPDTAAHIGRFMCQTNANELALRAGLASLRDKDLVARSIGVNTRAKQILYQCLDELDLEYFPTHTNFVMHRINGDLTSYRNRMREHNVQVGRPFPPMLTYNRLSLGLPEEMVQFTEILRTFRTNGWV